MRRLSLLVVVLLLLSSWLPALEPPTREQLERYRQDGSFARRLAEARAIGNHRVSPHLVQQLAVSLGKRPATEPIAGKGLPAVGAQHIFALLIAFADEPPSIPSSDTVPYRAEHVATVLADGRVLIAGGRYSAFTELYDPVSDTWTHTDPLDSPRAGAAATLLPSGWVLLSGGSFDGPVTHEDNLIFDPVNARWLSADPFAEPRFNHTASLLADGTILVTGGVQHLGSGSSGTRYITSIERYQPPGGDTPRRPRRRISPRRH